MPFADPERRREYIRNWMAKRRAEYFAGKVCATPGCGTTQDLQLDHIDPSLKVTHRIWSWAKEKREAELAKCQVLCGPCHLAKTEEDMGYVKLEHGTMRMYKHHNCKCQACRAEAARVKAQQRAARLAAGGNR